MNGRLGVAAVAMCAVAGLSGCGCASSSAASTVTKTVTKTVTATPSSQTPEAAYTPTSTDFAIKLKILSKQCFGSAGCNVEFRVEPTYSGQPVADGQSVEVTYTISGSDDAYSNTFTMTGDQSSVQRTESVQSKRGKISATITDVSLVAAEE